MKKENYLTYMPDLASRSKLLAVYIFQIFTFMLLIVFYIWISSRFILGAPILQLVVNIGLISTYLYILKNNKNIRIKYRKDYGDLAYQKFFYRFIIFWPPVASAINLYPLLLKTDYFLPAFVNLPHHMLTRSMLPAYIVLPLGIGLAVIGILIKRAATYLNSPETSYLLMNIIYPEDSKLIKKGIYKLIRHPQYLGESLFIIGMGLIANCPLAILTALIPIFFHPLVIYYEDKEMLCRFGKKFEIYKHNVPAFFPRLKYLKDFVRLVF